MDKLGQITGIIKNDLDVFGKRMKTYTHTENAYVSDMLNYILSSKGKLIRPLLVYLSARMFGEPTESTHSGAVLMELIHSSTLVHDDVVDEALLRRGKASANAIWENKRAVLIGDYMFANAMYIATQKGEHKLFDLISPTIMKMSLGELMQLDIARKSNFDEAEYFEVIENKTASLIATCCEVGAYSAGASADQQHSMRTLGMLCGMAFRIKDDILDYSSQDITGKIAGNDILERKVTLPLIGALKNSDPRSAENVLQYWKNGKDNKYLLSLVSKFVLDNQGINYASEIMLEYHNQALQQLDGLNNNKAGEAMQQLLDFVVERKK